MENKMRGIKLEKVVLNIGTGEGGSKLNNAVKLLEKITGRQPSRRQCKVKIVKWDIRPGLEIGAMVTLRNAQAEEMFQKALNAVNHTMRERSVSDNGNLSIGIKEYIDLPGINYDPEIGIFGMDMSCKFKRAGERISRRKKQKRKVPAHQKITKEEARKFLAEKYNVKFE